jgi:cleavage stimulation factor subunit 3
MNMRYYPEIYYEAALYYSNSNKADEAVSILKTGLEIMPLNLLLNFLCAEIEESRKKNTEAKQLYETLLKKLEKEIEVSKDPSSEYKSPFVKAEELPGLLNLTFIQFMKFSRRSEGIKAARLVFSRARKSSECSYHIFVFSALMEYYCSKDKTVAFKIFDLGMKSFGDDPKYVIEYIQFLMHTNDDHNLRTLFEKSVSTIPAEFCTELWDAFIKYESKYGKSSNSILTLGDFHSTSKLEKRRLEAYPEETLFASFIKYHSYMDLTVLTSLERTIQSKQCM